MAAPKATTLQQRMGFSDPDLKSPQHDALMLALDMNIEAIIDSILPPLVGEWKYEQSGFKELKDKLNSDYWTRRREVELKMTNEIWEQVKRPLNGEEWAKINAEVERIMEPETPDIEAISARELAAARAAADAATPDLSRKIAKKWEVPITTGQSNNPFTVGFADMRVTVTEPDVCLLYPGGGFAFHWGRHHRIFYFEVKPTIASVGEVMRQIRHYETYTADARWFIASPDVRFKSVFEGQNIGFVDLTPFMEASA